MKGTIDYITILRAFKQKEAERYGIEEIGIFGSVARGEHKEGSDVDVCVGMKTPNLMLFSGIRQDLEQRFGCHVDIVRKHKHMSRVFLRNLERDCIYA